MTGTDGSDDSPPRGALDRVSDPVVAVDDDLRYSYLNDPAEELFGTGGSLVGDHISEADLVSDEETAADIRRLVEDALTSRQQRVSEQYLPGEERWVEIAVYPGEDGVTVLFTESTVRRDTPRDVEYFRGIIENVPVGIYRNTPGADGEFVEVNPAMVSMFDADSREELLGCAVSDLYADPAERRRVSEQLRQEGIVVEEELRLETLTGTQFWGSVTAVTTETDEDLYFDGVVLDITARKEYERRLEEQRDDLELLNQMVRHDIRNDLQLVLAYAELLGDHVDEAGRSHLEKILESAENAVTLTKTARDLAEVMLRSDAEPQRVALDHTLERTLDDVRASHSDSVVTVEGGLPSVAVRADEMLDSVVRNLLKNAIQHNDKNVARVVVSVREREDDVLVHIADNGPGIPDQQKEEIFGKGEKGLESEGTGLGLYLVSSLVEGYGGDVWVEDNEPEGSVFTLALPKADSDHGKP